MTKSRTQAPRMNLLEKATNQQDRGFLNSAGAEGFEPTNGGSKNRCLTTWRHPSMFCENKTEHKDRVFRDFWQRKSLLGNTMIRSIIQL